MGLRKCCVGNCSSNNKTHRLFYLPKDDTLRLLWLSFLIPTNVELSGLSRNQLLTKLVCQDHFDRHQFDGMGNRLRNGYPCLFSPNEIRYGIPLSYSDGDHLSDHNYSIPLTPIRDIDTIIVKDIPETREHVTEPIFAETSDPPEILDVEDYIQFKPIKKTHVMKADTPESMEPEEQVMEPTWDETTDIPESTESTEQVKEPILAETTDPIKNRELKYFILYEPNKNTQVKKVVKNKNNKSKSSTKKVIKQPSNAKENSFENLSAEAKIMRQGRMFLKNLSKMKKPAQTFINMQLKSVSRKKKGLRFTNDEKSLALSLMKESPEGYRLIQKIFNLPTKRTLDRLLAEERTGINKNILRPNEES